MEKEIFKLLFSLLEVDGTTVNTIVGIVGTLVTIVFGLPAVISGLLFFIRRLNIKKFYDVFFSTVLNNRKPNSLERYRFMHYIKHSFTLENLQSTRENISYKEFINFVKNTKIVILTGSAGIGKSILMQRLALKFRSKIQKNKSGQILDDYGILFYKLNRQSNLEKIINEVEEKIKSSSIPYSLYFDGLDEISDLSTCTGTQILNDFLNKLLNGISQKCSRIFISLRPEILERGYTFSLPYEEDDISIFKIQNFNEKQIMAMYHNENHNYSEKIKLKTRRQNFKKLKTVIKNNPKSVFTYPLILTWANEILSDCDIKELTYISWYDALGKVIDKELEREYNIYRRSKGIVIGDTPYSRTQFIEDGKNFLTDIAVNMALSESQSVTRNTVLENTIVKKFKEQQKETTGNTFLTRRLLRYVDWSEKLNSQLYYEFIHNTIFWRALAGAILNFRTPQNIRAKIILSQTQTQFSAPLLSYCHQGLWSQYGKKIFNYVDYLAYMRAIGNKVVDCIIKDSKSLPLEVILSCFYGFNEVTCGYSFRFNFSQIEDFVKDRKLNLSNTSITDLTLLNKFSKNSFDFLDCSNSDVVKAEIPDYVKKINFYKCTALKGVYIKNLSAWCNIDVGFNPLKYAKNLYLNGELVAELVIPDDVIKINDGVFNNCISLKSVTIPNGVKIIGNYAFENCSSLEHIVLPDSLTNIGAGAFENCKSLANVIVPNKVKNIADCAFAGCSTLQNIVIGNSVKNIEQYAFAECIALANVEIPDNVEYIGREAFRGCVSIKKLAIGKGVNNIGDNAFENCTGLTDIFFNATACNLGKDGDGGAECTFFENAGICESGITVTIGADIKKIPVGIFLTNRYANTRYNKPHKITKVNFAANSVCEHIGAYAFSGCNLIEDIVLPDSLKSIGSNAFSNCDMLKKVHLGTNFESMVYAFPLCKSLMEISVSSDNKNYKSIAGILYSFDGKTLIRFPSGKSDTSFKVSKNVKRIGDWAFEGCSRLKDITLPDSIMSIGAWAFGRTAYYENEDNWEDGILYIDKHLIEVKEKLSENYKIKSGILTIAKNAFRFHGELKSITFPDSVTAIGEYAFFGCKGLTNVSIPESVKFIDKAAFTACDALVKFAVSSKNKYYKSIDGNLYSFDGKAFIQYAVGKSEASFCVPDSVTIFGDYVFRDCHLTSITLPDGVLTISNSMFEGCRELASITIPDSVTSIGNRAFACCSGLTSLIIPNRVKKIDDEAFYGCSSLTSLILPNSVDRISKRMVAECSKLTTIIIPDGVTVIDDEAFFNCWSLINISLPKSVTYMSLSAFSCNYSPPKSVIKVFYDGVVEKWNSIEKNYIVNLSFCRVKEIECIDGIVKIK